jgi:hypothetical protein
MNLITKWFSSLFAIVIVLGFTVGASELIIYAAKNHAVFLCVLVGAGAAFLMRYSDDY